MSPKVRSSPSLVFSFLRPLVFSCAVIIVAAWICTIAFYVRPGWLGALASYGIYWEYAAGPTTFYVLPGLSIATGVCAVIGTRLKNHSTSRLCAVALACAIIGLVTTLVIPILEPAW